jgi:hypothetical protein
MTSERNKALMRVRASFAAYRDVEASSGTFQIEDIKQLLETLEEKDQVLNVVVEDLNDLLASYELGHKVDGGMLNSTLVFVKGYLV